jgi:micrococcal nuclease
MKKIILIVGLLALAASPVLASSTLSGTVISVGDGDTLTMKTAGGNKTIRLGCIDAPETKQSPWGDLATKQLKSLLPVGTAISVRSIDVDKYGRTVGEVSSGEKLINLELVSSGHAVVYRQYLGGCPSTAKRYTAAEDMAKASKLIFWSQTCPTMPWDFRRGIQAACAQKPPKQGYVSGTCKALKAQGIYGPFYRDQGDPNYRPERDRDKDGIACE